MVPPNRREPVTHDMHILLIRMCLATLERMLQRLQQRVGNRLLHPSEARAHERYAEIIFNLGAGSILEIYPQQELANRLAMLWHDIHDIISWNIDY